MWSVCVSLWTCVKNCCEVENSARCLIGLVSRASGGLLSHWSTNPWTTILLNSWVVFEPPDKVCWPVQNVMKNLRLTSIWGRFLQILKVIARSNLKLCLIHVAARIGISIMLGIALTGVWLLKPKLKLKLQNPRCVTYLADGDLFWWWWRLATG